ncbi:MAG: glycine--tRNA ligase [Patescibacteria group bacterium]|nr:glycine--tRNA ligase [Patescibacteria group bacterium]
MTNESLMEKIISLSKRRGFIFPSSEIYGGFESGYDYGPLGVELKNNLKKVWWKNIVQERKEIVGLDAAILMNPKVWEASGHLSAGFADCLVECKNCHKRFKETETGNRCPVCGGEFLPARKFNLMMKTYVGPIEDESAVTYLRAETCQGIYMNFLNVLNVSRLKIPFGIAQIGKSFRNEITPSNFIFRTREFEQMEMQFFVRPSEAEKWYEYWKKERLNWYLNLGIKKENIKLQEHKKEELAHYAKAGCDIVYHFPFGWQEIEGIHNRGDWDLSRHSKYSGQDLSYFDPITQERYIPYIIETSGGIDRALLTFLIDAYQEVKGGRTTTTKASKEVEVVLKLDKNLAPIKIAIFPLVKKEPLIKLAQEIYQDLKKYWLVDYDETDSIGRRYRRQDEIGTPYAVTIDFESINDQKVTVRDRDTMKQERVEIKNLRKYFFDKFYSF